MCKILLSIMRKLSSRVAFFSPHSSSGISTLESTTGQSVGILMYQSISGVSHLRKSITSERLGFECIQVSLDMSVELCISSPCTIPYFCQHFWQNISFVNSEFSLVASCVETEWCAITLVNPLAA